jgi:hypothetical protein
VSEHPRLDALLDEIRRQRTRRILIVAAKNAAAEVYRDLNSPPAASPKNCRAHEEGERS